jgi:hypothetical protein
MKKFIIFSVFAISVIIEIALFVLLAYTLATRSEYSLIISALIPTMFFPISTLQDML